MCSVGLQQQLSSPLAEEEESRTQEDTDIAVQIVSQAPTDEDEPGDGGGLGGGGCSEEPRAAVLVQKSSSSATQESQAGDEEAIVGWEEEGGKRERVKEWKVIAQTLFCPVGLPPPSPRLSYPSHPPSLSSTHTPRARPPPALGGGLAVSPHNGRGERDERSAGARSSAGAARASVQTLPTLERQHATGRKDTWHRAQGRRHLNSEADSLGPWTRPVTASSAAGGGVCGWGVRHPGTDAHKGGGGGRGGGGGGGGGGGEGEGGGGGEEQDEEAVGGAGEESRTQEDTDTAAQIVSQAPTDADEPGDGGGARGGGYSEEPRAAVLVQKSSSSTTQESRDLTPLSLTVGTLV